MGRGRRDKAVTPDNPDTPFHDARDAEGEFAPNDDTEPTEDAVKADVTGAVPADADAPEGPVEVDAEGQAQYEGMSKEDAQASTASSLGGTDNYAYVDQTRVPLEERTYPVTSPLSDISQAEANPAFTPKQEDGGPVHPVTGEGIGTEPNVHEEILQTVEDDPEAKAAVEAEIEAGKEQQMDVDAVNAAAEERTPDDVDASTGQKE